MESASSGIDKSNTTAKESCVSSERGNQDESETDSVLSDCNYKIDSKMDHKIDDILVLVEKLQKYIRKQKKLIKKLKAKIKHCRVKKKLTHASTQTGDIEEKCKEQEPKTLTEEIKEAAENAVHQTGFVYEATSGMYYDYNTGYYYNAELGLYYDGNNGRYLVYNNETKSYEFHSQVETSTTQTESSSSKRKQQQNQDGKPTKVTKLTTDTVLEEGECSSSDNDEETRSSDSADEHLDSDLAKSWPPCMRIILKETSLSGLKLGSLFMVTCDGGTIGREGDHSILIPDVNVSKHHAKITFDREANYYTIIDLGSQNGTLLNGKRLSVAKQESDPQEIVHGSIIQIGSTKLLCHIHEGQKTCGHCEPGLVQVEESVQQNVTIEKPAKPNTQYKKELRRLKKKFGLETQDNSNMELAPGYTDRANERRKHVGSHAISEKTQVASVHESIPVKNKGFKMLSKMGWTEGQSLGKEGTGLTEPLPLVGNEGRVGLGCSMEAPPEVPEKKINMWKRTQQRYQHVQEMNLDAFQHDDSED